MKPQTQWTWLAAIVVAGFYLCGGGCIGLGVRGEKVDTSQVVVGSALLLIPTFALGVFLVRYLLGYEMGAKGERERRRHQSRLRAERRELSPLQRGAAPPVPPFWTPIAELTSATQRLGRIDETFANAARPGRSIFNAACVGVGGLALLGVGIAVMTTRPNPGLGIALLIIAGLAAVGGGISMAIYAVKKTAADLRVLIYEKGLVRVDRAAFIVFLWDDILELYQVIVDVYQYGLVHAGREYGFGLYRCDGEELHINEGVQPRDVGPLSDVLQTKVAERLLPKAKTRIAAGGDVVFGALTLNRDGIRDEREAVPWSEVDGVKIADGVVRIQRKGQWSAWSNVAARDIPNLYAFLTLVDELVGVNR